MARSMLSEGMFALRHFRSTMRKRGFMSGSDPPWRVQMVISLPSLAKIRPRLASIAPLKCLTFAHLLCPAIFNAWLSALPELRALAPEPYPKAVELRLKRLTDCAANVQPSNQIMLNSFAVPLK